MFWKDKEVCQFIMGDSVS